MVPNFLMTGGMPRLAESFYSHDHAFWEIVLYTRGEGVATVGEQPVRFRPGTIICNPPRVPHSETSKDGFQNMWVAIRELQTTGEGEGVPVVHLYREHPIFSIVSLMHVERHLQKATSEMILGNLFSTFMIYLNEHLSHDPHERVIQHVMRVLSANVQNPWFRVADAFAEVPLSRDHVRRLFKERAGMSPIQYLVALRMTRAKELLQMGFTVKETADKVGLDDQYYFSRLFRKTQAMSPSEYRRRVNE
jgi:AraC-like DNA-binding protein